MPITEGYGIARWESVPPTNNTGTNLTTTGNWCYVKPHASFAALLRNSGTGITNHSFHQEIGRKDTRTDTISRMYDQASLTKVITSCSANNNSTTRVETLTLPLGTEYVRILVRGTGSNTASVASTVQVWVVSAP